ncbi:MAG: U32 family peptidase [Bacteroidales bacterium]|nr:U32 family peptidase [Bacteroidales bacterium]
MRQLTPGKCAGKSVFLCVRSHRRTISKKLILKIELLSPAKDLATGIAAVNHGADAVYIGGPRFGARAAAGNSIEDLERLAAYAHRFRARIHVTVNTILKDRELEETGRLVWRLYEAGIDAFIVQDMGLLSLDLPPVPLHASTQADNRTAEKVRFLQDVGFDRAVLARELSLQQIADIHAKCDIDLEAFVHGALCVCYSGQCYLSHALTGRSANRGACAQPCRLAWDLEDGNGNILLKDKHLLSLKDMDRSQYLREMIAAGITSFKIEGRLKDIAYVKNVTARYRTLLDSILGRDGLEPASAGRTVFTFTPDPARTFHRGGTDYFLKGRNKDMTQWETPKSVGAEIGKLVQCGRGFLDITTDETLRNGDGLCQGRIGFRINRAEQTGPGRWRVYPAAGTDTGALRTGQPLRRNADTAFLRLLEGDSARRTIRLHLQFTETAEGFAIQITDEEGVRIARRFTCEKIPAVKPEQATETVRDRLMRWGGTIYEAVSCDIDWSEPRFIPSARLSAWRKEAAEALEEARIAAWQPLRRQRTVQLPVTYPTDGDAAGYRLNILNHAAADFYRVHGIPAIEAALEAESVNPDFADRPRTTAPVLMTCKYCIRHAMGWCTRTGKPMPYAEPLFLRARDRRFKLRFDCRRCEMQILPDRTS